MAYIHDRTGRNLSNDPTGPGVSADLLTEVMVSAQMRNARLKVPAKRRYAESVVRAAIRRDGYTDADQRLIMTADERQEWERLNPLAD